MRIIKSNPQERCKLVTNIMTNIHVPIHGVCTRLRKINFRQLSVYYIGLII